jgi:hypothetical protein
MKLHVERKTNRAGFCSRRDVRFRHLISSRALGAALIAADRVIHSLRRFRLARSELASS